MAELVKEYYSGQGMVYAAPYVGGVVQTEKMRWIGNVPSLELSFETDTAEHKESHSGTRQKDLVLRKELSASFALTMEDFSVDNLAMAFMASVESAPNGKVTDETSSATLKAGDYWLLSKQKISKLAIKDSTTGSAVKLQVGVHYEVDETYGRVKLLDANGLTLPLLATFEHEASNTLNLLTEIVEGWYLRLEGLNTANGNAPVLVEIVKAYLSPAKTLSLINDELSSFELAGNALLHNGKTVKITKL